MTPIFSSTRVLLRLVVLTCLLVATMPVAVAKPRAKTAPYKIAAIQAKLFYDSNGTFSRDVLAAPKFTFWNTVIGEGDAEAPSSATLVVVEVQGEGGTAGDGARKVNLTVTAGRRVLLNRTNSIGLFTTGGKFYAAFWVYDTGCQPLKLTAKIVGQMPALSKTATVPFACGE